MSSSNPEQPRVLIVDDEKVIRDMLADFLGMEGYMVRTAEDGTRAVDELSRDHFDLVISDLKMPKMGGIALLDEVGKLAPDAITIIMTGFGTVETAIDAMKKGAYDYVLKPFKLDEVVHVVQRGIEKQRMAAENLRLREALSLYKVSEAIAASLSLDQVMDTVADSVLHEVRSDLVSIWLDNGEGDFFRRIRRAAIEAPERKEPTETEALAALAHSATAGDASDNEKELGTLAPRAVLGRLGPDQTLIEHGDGGLPFFAMRPQRPLVSLVAVPLRIQQRDLGFIAGLSYTPGKKFDEGQRKLLSIIASRAAAAIENARLYEDLQATFQQTIEGLAKAIDKMDRYTSGHSDRVAIYAVYLAKRLGLDDAMCEIVRQAALMHDIGKIGCVLNLNKPGKLTSNEYEEFKKHPMYGRDILDPIKFLNPLIPGVHLHHERWDGRGYPLKMKGNEIPLIARIISIADTYDAMTSNRSYRRALPHEVAVNEIDRCAGTQFDPDLAKTFNAGLEDFRDERSEAGIDIPE